MRALVSGQAALAVVLSGKPQLRPLGAEPTFATDPKEALRLFDGCGDARTVEVATSEELDTLLEREWATDRALRLLLLLMDSSEPDDDLGEYAACVEELLSQYPIVERLEFRLHSTALPKEANVGRAMAALESFSNAYRLLESVLKLQPAICRVIEAYETVSPSVFGGLEKKYTCRERLMYAGAFSRFAKSIERSDDVSFLLLELVSSNRAFSDGIRAWVSAISGLKARKPKVAPLQPDNEDDEWDDVLAAEARESSYEAFESVRNQQFAIVERIKHRDIVAATKFANELIEEQRTTSTPEQLAKTLCSLAQNAKKHEVPELQLEWATLATHVNPSDPITYGHLADALIPMGRFGEAEEAFAKGESLGDGCFAATGRARIARAMGDIQRARDLYLKVVSEFPNVPGVEYAWAGAAEALRDMGQSEAALEEYKRITHRWPTNPVFWDGLASTQLDLGLLADAVSTFGKAGKDQLVAMNGKATAFKLAGNFRRALELYDQVISVYPNNHVSLCGRADVLRAERRYEDALGAYDLAIERSPFSPAAYRGKAGLLRELRRYSEATELYEFAQNKFPWDHQLAAGNANIMRNMGRLDEALRLFDEVIRRFPFDRKSRVRRANILRRLGRLEDALSVYSALLTEYGHYADAFNGKAATLISLKRFAEAEEMVRGQNPKTQAEWSRFALRAILLSQTGRLHKAISELERGVRSTPFARQRQVMKDALATIHLTQNASKHALRLIHEPEGRIGPILHLHALAASNFGGQARQRYNEILSEEPSEPLRELATEIVRHFRVIEGGALRSREWILATERQEVLLAAA